jgi:hypothetical protein
LKDGERFDFQFMRAMCKATVVAPLVSWAALKRMTLLTEGAECDNVLLEWWLAVELHERYGTKVGLLIGCAVSTLH